MVHGVLTLEGSVVVVAINLCSLMAEVMLGMLMVLVLPCLLTSKLVGIISFGL